MKGPIGSLDPSIPEVHIWGAGISGLLMAHFLSRAGWKIHLYEKESILGGKIQSHQIPEGVFEEGPNALYATSEIENWLRELGLTVVPANKKLKRRIWREKPEKPITLWGIVKLIPSLFKVTPKLTNVISVADFFRPLLKDKVESLLTPALQGIYGVGAESLSMKSIWPNIESGTYLKVIKQLKGPKARSVSFPTGMKELVDRLAIDFKDHITFNQKEFCLRPNTIICTDAYSAAELLEANYSQWSQALKQVQYQHLSSVMALTEKAPEMDQTFGFLFPRQLGIHSLGVLFNTEIFPNRCGATFIVADSDQPHALVESDLLKLGWRSKGLFIHSWTKALPVYDSQRLEVMSKLHQYSLNQKGLVLFGNYVAGISLRDMISAAKYFATKERTLS